MMENIYFYEDLVIARNTIDQKVSIFYRDSEDEISVVQMPCYNMFAGKLDDFIDSFANESEECKSEYTAMLKQVKEYLK